jgi:hypothetical protein
MATVSSTASLSVTASTPSVSTSSRSIALRYLGDTSDGDYSIVTKSYADTYFRNNGIVDSSWVTSRCNSVSSNVLSQSQVSASINATDSTGSRLYPTISQLNALKDTYADVSSLGAANGIAVSNFTGGLNPIYVPSDIVTNNNAIFYDCLNYSTSYRPTGFTGSATYIAGDGLGVNNPTGFEAARVIIPDPGFSYYLMNFVYIKGKASGSATFPTLASSNKNIGNILVATTAGTNSLPKNYLARGIAAPSPNVNWHVAVPFVFPWGDSAPTRPRTGTTAFRGPTSMSLYLSNYQSSGYTFYAEGLMWIAILFPTLTPNISAGA